MNAQSDPQPAPIRFAVHCDSAALEPWQSRCIEKLCALPAVRQETLHARNLDFILSFSFLPCPRQASDAARFGVWRYEFGDLTALRTGPAGFREVYEGRAVTGAFLVRQALSPDHVIVLRSGYLRTDVLSWRRNRAQLQERFTHWPAQVCVDIRNGVAGELDAPAVSVKPAHRRTPSLTQKLVYACRVGLRAARALWRSLFRHEQWNVGIIDRPVSSFLQSDHRERVRWLPAPGRNEFRADPFGLIRAGALTVLCEQFSYRTSRGIIVSIEPDAPRPAFTPVNIGPAPGVHLSYPYLLELDGRTLCMPESCAAAELALYEAARFPDRWSRSARLIGSPVVVDATPFRHGGLWWLAASDDAPKGASSELNLWYARDVDGPWQPHVGNPVKIDVRSARPGGTPFYSDGVLYRPAQDCARIYGARLAINRVEVLTPTEFREVTARVIEPDPAGPYPEGLHTLSGVGEITLIDSKRLVFAPAEFRRALGYFIVQALRAMRGRRA